MFSREINQTRDALLSTVVRCSSRLSLTVKMKLRLTKWYLMREPHDGESQDTCVTWLLN